VAAIPFLAWIGTISQPTTLDNANAFSFRLSAETLQQPALSSIQNYRADAATPPINRWVEIAGPGVGHPFGSGLPRLPRFLFVGRTGQDPRRPGMSDLEKAMAVYRFSAGSFYSFSMAGA